eukprot:symbB.v1.2.019404.t1/scaffold1587.1/size141350/1
MEVAVFQSSGVDRKKQRFKASFHMVFPDVIVRRPELCNGTNLCETTKAASHILARDYVVQSLDECRAQQRLDELKKKISDEKLEAVNGDGSPVRRNDWCEILDENPLWHDPRPGIRTGFRLPFTDKSYAQEAADNENVSKETEGRVKLPVGRWSFQAGMLKPLPDLTAVEWVRMGDISRPVIVTETTIDEQKLQKICQTQVPCLVCPLPATMLKEDKIFLEMVRPLSGYPMILSQPGIARS